MRSTLLACALVVFSPELVAAEWQVRPFIGVTFGGDTTFVLNEAAGDSHRVFGVSGGWLGEVVGIEGDLGYSPGFFDSPRLVLSSRVTTATANVVVALPRRWTRYTLRPYVAAGGGVMRVRSEDRITGGLLGVDRTLPTMNVGGGATGFFTDRVGVNWELRYFRSFSREPTGVSIGDEQLSFWRATMALALRLDRRAR